VPDNFSTSAGGTIFSTTPGGTRIVYDRVMMMQLKQSPLSQTPPSNGLASIPGVTLSKSRLEQKVIPGELLEETSQTNLGSFKETNEQNDAMFNMD